MKKLEKTNNQWALAVRLLIEYYSKGVTMRDAINEHFYKFQSRLCEVERGRENKMKIKREKILFKNRFNHSGWILNYRSTANIGYLINLHNKLCKFGAKSIK